MRWDTRPYFKLEAFKTLFTTVVTFWAIAATVLLLKKNIVLIGMDENGVRVIGEEKDRLVAQEKINLVKRFLIYQYNYDAKDYGEKMTLSGNLMSNPLWRSKSSDFFQFKESLKLMPEYRHEGFIAELRQVDDSTFEADLVLTEHKKLSHTDRKMTVEIKVASRFRNLDNPYAWEVIHYVENHS